MIILYLAVSIYVATFSFCYSYCSHEAQSAAVPVEETFKTVTVDIDRHDVGDVNACLSIVDTLHVLVVYHCNITAYHSVRYASLDCIGRRQPVSQYRLARGLF